MLFLIKMKVTIKHLKLAKLQSLPALVGYMVVPDLKEKNISGVHHTT